MKVNKQYQCTDDHEILIRMQDMDDNSLPTCSVCGQFMYRVYSCNFKFHDKDPCRATTGYAGNWYEAQQYMIEQKKIGKPRPKHISEYKSDAIFSYSKFSEGSNNE